MANKFKDQNAAARLREVVRKIALEVVLDEIPRPRFATVTAVDTIAGRVTCQYPDEVGNTFTVPTSLVSPMAVGSIVRIAGHRGARYVDEVMSGSVRIRGLNRLELTDTAQSIPDSTLTDITWSGAETQDLDGWATVGSATLTVPTNKNGRYLVTFNARWASATLGTMPGAFGYVNGASTFGAQGISQQGLHTLTYTRAFVAGDFLKFQLYQNSGGAVNCTSRLDIMPLP